MNGTLYCVRGASIGAVYAERVEMLYAASHDELDQESWHRRFGTDLPHAVPIDERERDVRDEFGEFCAKHYPEFVGRLGLA